jgi:hypothetical protein
MIEASHASLQTVSAARSVPAARVPTTEAALTRLARSVKSMVRIRTVFGEVGMRWVATTDRRSASMRSTSALRTASIAGSMSDGAAAAPFWRRWWLRGGSAKRFRRSTQLSTRTAKRR